MKFPPRSDVPQEFFSMGNPWNRMAENLFFDGASKVMDKIKALPEDQVKQLKEVHRHLGDRQYEHNHKIAACAYLYSTFLKEPIL